MRNGRHGILAIGVIVVALLVLFPQERNYNYYLAAIVAVAAGLLWWNEGRGSRYESRPGNGRS
jgi:hypothetical protein